MDRFLEITPARPRSLTSDSSSTPRIASSPLRPLNLALNLEDEEDQEIVDDPLTIQTEVIDVSSQKSPVWEFFDKMEDRGKAQCKTCIFLFLVVMEAQVV